MSASSPQPPSPNVLRALFSAMPSSSTSSSAASSPEASTSTMNPQMNQSPDVGSHDPRLDEILVPALLDHDALPIHLKLLFDAVVPTCAKDAVEHVISRCGWTIDEFRKGFIALDPTTGLSRTSWRCVNLPTTLQILNIAKTHFPEFAPAIDGLRAAMTQMILMNLVNSQNQNVNTNQNERAAVASVAPGPTLVKPELDVTIPAPQRRDSILSTLSGTGNPSSPDTDAISVITDSSGDGMSSGGKSLRSLKNLKKRVLCEKCFRTFCDKGALKIHNSSVHLREMHMCTVPGCTKQFPSKRSRNRHSNNPKMHTDAGRRRNCRTTMPVTPVPVSSQSIISPSSVSGGETRTPLPNHHESHSPQVFALLQRFMASAAANNVPSSSTTTTSSLSPISSAPTPLQPPQPSVATILGCLNNPIIPQPSSNASDVTNLLKLVIAQRQKIALC